MDFFNQIYERKLQENNEQIRFWEDHIKALNDVQFKLYSDKLKVPVLVPIGSRILFRGELKHTNEVTTSLGMGYFAKCSTEQAEILRQHRIKDAKSKLDVVMREKEYLEGQKTFKNQTVFNDRPELIEYETEEEDRLWREKHKENLKLYYQNKSKKEELNKDEISDDELWNRLEELELQEELQNELAEDNENMEDVRDSLTYNKKNEDHIENMDQRKYDITKEILDKTVSNDTHINPENTCRLDLLQNVLDKQKELEEKIFEIKNRERNVTKTESDLMSRLDELEQLEEVEDEMDRLDDVLYEPEPADEVEENKNSVKVKRSVSFADQDESETLEITFKHSNVPANEDSYDPKKGILKPSDVYDAFSHLFPETTSILRKTKYKPETTEPSNDLEQSKKINFEFKRDNATNIVFVFDDVKEKELSKQRILDNRHKRPVSIFKKRRQQKH
ncbi:PREDICTED: unconventional prefoldin RPB5 interactor-like [Papilio xuthus]|uniref:Unconventional prefoldin RPB5 interactor-like n=1 Tax=Papilio xuthus TaxID=66420 RepID=A0AAJ7EFY1_PAPXU|nr:PREDICTED: unconventional prefoldin RPB5 interactor-like [Papilio xuthus]